MDLLQQVAANLKVEEGKAPDDAAARKLMEEHPVVAGGYRGFDPSACTYGSPEQVTERLGEYADRSDVIVLALPRGGVPVAVEVAAHRSSVDRAG